MVPRNRNEETKGTNRSGEELGGSLLCVPESELQLLVSQLTALLIWELI